MGLREQVNLLMAHGHPEARFYPVPVVWTEVGIVRTRLNREMASNAVLMQLAISSVLSEKAGKAFQKQVKKLSEG